VTRSSTAIRPTGTADARRDRIDEQSAKAVAGPAPVKRNRFTALDSAAKSVDPELEVKPRAWPG
jgi:hypothetical protein